MSEYWREACKGRSTVFDLSSLCEHYNSVTKQQLTEWRHSSNENLHMQKSDGKVFDSAFWDYQGILFNIYQVFIIKDNAQIRPQSNNDKGSKLKSR